jgi:hypothetical protein
MLSGAALSPKTRGVADLDDRIAALSRFETWSKPTRLDYANLLGEHRWREYLALLDAAVRHLSAAQRVAIELRAVADQKLANQPRQPTANAME